MRERPSPWLVASVSFLIASAVAAVVVWPQGVGAERVLPFVWATALRGAVLIALPVAAVALVVAALRRRTARAAVLPVAAVLILACAASALVLERRGFTPASAQVESRASTGGEIRILSWNTEHAAPGPDWIGDVIDRTDADVVMLPETDEAATASIAAVLQARGHRVAHDTVAQPGFPGSVPTSVMFIDDLAAAGYRIDAEAGSTPGQPSGRWIPDDLDAPVIGSVHTVPPTPWGLPLWSSGLDWVAASCADARAIVAGDLNATLDHFGRSGAERADLGGCRDAAAEVGAAARGTWPTDAPEWLASSIDHVLVGSAWQVLAVDVLDAGGEPSSDHRAVLAVVAPAG